MSTQTAIHSLQINDTVEDRIADAFQGATIVLAGLIGVLIVAVTAII
jgi:hypothetical protein